MIIVFIWYLRRLNLYQVKIKDYYSNLEGVDLSWLKYFLWVYISVYTTSFTVMVLYAFELIINLDLAFRIISVSIFSALVWMIYNGLKQYSLANFSDVELNESDNVKYETSSLQKEDSEKLFKKIDQLFKEQMLFINPDLKLQDVARTLNSTNHKISQSINENAGISFYNYVNNFRVNYFKLQLADPEKRKFTILTLGFDSGFNSKASMNRIFKKQVGVTPREYLKTIHS
ncbi:MAG: helix-turn-helix domain-containing protein [bacterium]|nr:helix-turn-helix domain-containing protein [bacterium]